MSYPTVGTNVVTTVSRRYILPKLVDMVYGTNALYWRLNKNGKKSIQGGYHAEIPMMVSELSNGGPFQGYDVLDVSPNDTVIAGQFGFKQHYVPVTIDGRTLVMASSPEAVHNILSLQWDQARMQLADNLGTGLYSDGSNSKEITGLEAAVDDGSVAANYAGLARASHPYLNAQVDDTTATMTLGALRAQVSDCTIGGHTPSIIFSRKEQYNRLWNLLIANQLYTAPLPDLQQAGFTNLGFDGIPWVLDDKVFDGPNATNSSILFLNEDCIYLAIWGGTDFAMVDFQQPINQNAFTGRLHWNGELMVLNPQVQGKMTNISA